MHLCGWASVCKAFRSAISSAVSTLGTIRRSFQLDHRIANMLTGGEGKYHIDKSVLDGIHLAVFQSPRRLVSEIPHVGSPLYHAPSRMLASATPPPSC